MSSALDLDTAVSLETQFDFAKSECFQKFLIYFHIMLWVIYFTSNFNIVNT